MRNTIAICAMALSLAACGGKDKPAENRSNAVEYVNVVDETVPAETTLPAGGGDTTIPPDGESAPALAATPEQKSLVAAIKAVPQDKRFQMAALLECEEAKIPGGVSEADRPAFIQKNLETLSADPSAVAHCRAGSQTPAQ